MPAMRSAGSCSEAVRLIFGHNSTYDSFNSIDIFLDVEHALPTELEKSLYDLVEKVLLESEKAIVDLNNYGNGAMMDVKKAIQNPDDLQIQEDTLQVLRRYFNRTRDYFEIALRIRQVVPNLLWYLCAGPLSAADQIEKSQALSLQFGQIIDFVHRFDATKMQTPALMNDISFYRRMMMKSDSVVQASEDANIEQANEILMFFSDSSPMLKNLVNATNDFVVQSDLSISNTTDTLATFVYICRHMLERKMNADRISTDTQDFFLRVMVGSFILLDHTDPNGAFHRQSSIDVRAIVNVIKRNEKESERYLNALRFTTKHFNDQTTPKSIKALFN